MRKYRVVQPRDAAAGLNCVAAWRSVRLKKGPKKQGSEGGA